MSPKQETDKLSSGGGLGQCRVQEPAKPLNNTGTPCRPAFQKSPASPGSMGEDQRFLGIKSTCGARRGGGQCHVGGLGKWGGGFVLNSSSR